MLLDGHLRLHAIREEGKATAPCIIADDDEAFTYNKRVNRLATVQEHYMIQRALDRGVPAGMIAAALGIDAKLVQRRSKLLDGIAPEAVDILKDRPVNPQVFDTLRRMKPERQFATAELMASMNNFTATYAKAILAATRQEDLARPERPKKVKGVTPEQMARMERELESLNKDFRAVEATFGDDVLHLVLASRYIERLIANDAISAYVEDKHPEILAEFHNIVAAGTLDAVS
jgi:ParB-like chromosome segregation protein Spo0J